MRLRPIPHCRESSQRSPDPLAEFMGREGVGKELGRGMGRDGKTKVGKREKGNGGGKGKGKMGGTGHGMGKGKEGE